MTTSSDNTSIDGDSGVHDLSLSDRILAWRDRLLASEKFRRWAGSFVFTRPLAQRRARELFDICAGFVYSQVLFACVRTRLFEILAAGPQSPVDLARQTALEPDALDRLLRAAISLGLVAPRSKGRFGLGHLGAAMVGNEGITAMVEHHALFYNDLRDPIGLLRGNRDTELSKYWPYAEGARPAELDRTAVAAYSRLMSQSQSLIAGEILAAHPLDKHRCLLDVGGGEGTFLMAAAAEHPHLALKLFDLPAVASIAGTRFAAAGLSSRAETFGGDFATDALPAGADVISLIRVAFDHPDEKVLAILRAIRRALPDDGTLLLAEPMAATGGAEPMGDAYFGFYLLAMGRGRSRSAKQIIELLRIAGFQRVRQVRTNMPLQTQLLVAKP
jgi:demethylspheroidene O-methyltransferase